GGEKGGVGKSVLARLLSQYFLDMSVAYTGLDADQSHPTLSRYYADYTQSINLDHFESIDTIMELSLEENRNVLIDLPAQSERFIDRWIDDNGVIEMCEEVNIRLIYWYAVDGGPDSVNLLQNFLEKYGDQFNIIVVKNQGRGCNFSDIEAISNLSDTGLAGKSVNQFYLPALHEPTMHKIEKYGFSFWAAANLKNSGAQHLSLMERQRSKVWINKIYQTFDSLITDL
ncbi:MAG: mobilization protein, partial [Candidatus Thiodiazotropha sp. 6PLUC3]